MLALVLSGGPARLGAAGDPGAAADLRELRSQIETVLRDFRVPGAGLALVRTDGPEWVGGFGLADVAAARPATADTLFRIGSVTKMFVALSALKLQAEGKLDLQDTLRSRAPDLVKEGEDEAIRPKC